MANTGKRIWNPNISCNDAITIAIDFLVRMRDKNVLVDKPVKLYKAYIIEGHHNLGVAREISSIFKFSNRDDPEMDIIRDEAARLLVISIKAHYFCFEQAKVAHEPYIFSIPDVSNFRRNIYGIIYKLDNNHSIVIGSEDLAKISEAKPTIGEFPVCLQRNSFKWFDRSHWKILKQEGAEFFNLFNPMKSEELEKIDSITKLDNFTYGTPIDIPYEIKDIMKPTGVRWAKGIKKWYIPKGFDKLGIFEYLELNKPKQK